jgi:hypothetical protein
VIFAAPERRVAGGAVTAALLAAWSGGSVAKRCSQGNLKRG